MGASAADARRDRGARDRARRATYAIRREPDRPAREISAPFFGAAALLPLGERVFGPLIMVPAIGHLVAWAAVMYPQLNRHPVMIFTTVFAFWLAPPLLEHLGLRAPTWSVSDVWSP